MTSTCLNKGRILFQKLKAKNSYSLFFICPTSPIPQNNFFGTSQTILSTRIPWGPCYTQIWLSESGAGPRF